jgi:hypothetical protein
VTIWMIVMICVGCAAALAGLVFMGLSVFRLIRAAGAAGQTASAHVHKLMTGAQTLGPQVTELQRKGLAVLEGIERVTASTNRLSYLRRQLEQPYEAITSLKK